MCGSWTEDRQVLEPSVEAISVDVVEGHEEPPAPPFGNATFLTLQLLVTFGHKANLEVAATHGATLDEVPLERRSRGPRVSAPRWTASYQVFELKPNRARHLLTEWPRS